MTERKIPVTEDELHAYVDDELPAERRGDVEAWLAEHPEDAERVRSWRVMAEALHARYDAVADEPVPGRLDVERLVRQPRKWFYGAVAVGFQVDNSRLPTGTQYGAGGFRLRDRVVDGGVGGFEQRGIDV